MILQSLKLNANVHRSLDLCALYKSNLGGKITFVLIGVLKFEFLHIIQQKSFLFNFKIIYSK